MSSWIVLFKEGTNEARVKLIDSIGPINKWTCLDEGAISPGEGEFTNQTNNVVPLGQPSWVLHAFDIDLVEVSSKGSGHMRDNLGSFPLGDFDWIVLEAV